MSTKLLRTARPMVLVVALIVVVLAAGSASPASAKSGGCDYVQGQVAMSPVDCSSPFGCASGSVTGGLDGTAYLTVTSLEFDLPNGVAHATGDIAFKLHAGKMTATTVMTYFLADMSFSEVMTITGGIGQYKDATGWMTATGTGDGTGSYQGWVCNRGATPPEPQP
jgi:hypothetical protein